MLDLHYTSIPPALWSAPVPLVGLAGDWNLLWHHYRRALPRCDLVLTDTLGVETLAREGIAHARPANLYGCGRDFLDGPPPEAPRDIDLLFVGNLHPDVQGERLPWLARLARLAGRWRVVIRGDVYGDGYRALLARARVVFNRAARGECNMRTFEAAAAGALLFQEADNREVPAFFVAGREYVAYGADDLEALLEYYLAREDERVALAAAAARRRVARYSFEDLWQDHLALVAREWDGMRARAGRRLREPAADDLLARVWQRLGSVTGDDPALIGDLGAALARVPRSAPLHHALGVTAARREPAGSGAAAESFRRAWDCDPAYLPSGLALAEALARAGRGPDAVAQALRARDLLDRQGGLDAAACDAGPYPPAYDTFRVAWERAAWENAGRPADEARAKGVLLRWRLSALLAELTGDAGHAYEAVLSRPDLPGTRALLGRLLLQAGRHDDAVPHLCRAAANPFDHEAARALFHALGEAGRGAEQHRLARERGLLARAAPGAAPPEDWHVEPPPLPPAARPRRRPGSLVWEGPQLILQSLTHVNRELCGRLIQRGWDVSLVPNDLAPGVSAPPSTDPTFAARFVAPPGGPAEFHVGHGWPPNLTPPPAGHWILMPPWEFGSPPRSWVNAMAREVDEVWVYTHYLRWCYVRGGVPADRVHVVPLGVDPDRFRPGRPPRPLPTAKRFKFLFVGGTLHRKGIDVLLGAYAAAFTAADDVCLVIKDMGTTTFYKGQTAGPRIAEFRRRAGAPAVEYLDGLRSAEELAGLYAACDCLAHPYRGEGFGLPIAEAMACGLPVVVTGYGAALDFCDEETAYLVPARLGRFPRKQVDGLETVDVPWLAEPDGPALARLLRHVVANPDEARAKGQAASARVRARFTWEQAADRVEERLDELRRRPVRRRAATVVAAPPARPRVSLCLIVRDEADELAGCLGSAAGLADETVVVDTGSADATRAVAARFGAKVVDFAWVDDFAAARNESLRHATGDWVFWLDADERRDGDARRALSALFAGLGDEDAAYLMTQLSPADDGSGSAMTVDQVRLFRRRPAARWQYRVHEQILPSLRRAGYELRRAGVVIRHGGFREGSASAGKLERNLRLLRFEEAERSGDPVTLYHLGLVLGQAGRADEALGALRRSLERAPPDASFRPKLHAMLGRNWLRLGRREEALAACRAGRQQYPDTQTR